MKNVIFSTLSAAYLVIQLHIQTGVLDYPDVKNLKLASK
jgi:hypothetical protein